MNRFPGCAFRPLDLRRLLRAHREPGERLIGWGIGRLGMDHSRTWFLHGTAHVPFVGPLLLVVLLARLKRFALLTDRRILLVPTSYSPKDSRARVSVLGVADIEVRVAGKPNVWTERRWKFHIKGAGEAKWMELLLEPRKKWQASSRLIEGFRLLAADCGSA